MLNWLNNLWRQITGDINNVVHWITSAIAAVYSYIVHLFDILAGDIADVARELDSWAKTVWDFIVQVYNYARAIVDVALKDLENWVLSLWNDVLSYAKSVWAQVVKWVDYLLSYIDKVWNDITSWVLKTIWNPLKNLIDGILHWITHEGALVYYYITHPDKLAALLGRYLWDSYLALLKRYGGVMAKWLMHQMLNVAGPFADVLETIMSALL